MYAYSRGDLARDSVEPCKPLLVRGRVCTVRVVPVGAASNFFFFLLCSQRRAGLGPCRDSVTEENVLAKQDGCEWSINWEGPENRVNRCRRPGVSFNCGPSHVLVCFVTGCREANPGPGDWRQWNCRLPTSPSWPSTVLAWVLL